MVKVILGFGNGNVENGCERITVEVRGDDDKLIARNNGSLPPSPQLWELYNSWKSSFIKHFGGRIILSKKPGSSSSQRKMELNQCIKQFPIEFNKWLLTDGFRPIEKLLRDYLTFDVPVNFTVEAEDNQLRRLPWYLWEFFEDYPNAEPAMAFTKYAGGKIGKSKRDNVRILVVIGDSQGIDTEVDKKIFQESLGDAEIKILSQPSRQELDAFLWDEQGWDILAFLGHSGSSEDGSTGKIQINENDSLSLTDLKYALSSAIKRGLQLAIFNSCDGLGLVRDLRDLYLPHCIVMREPVPDKVAQEFIKNFLPTFKDGKSLSLAVREAREKLQKWENNYPCATWLPVICQNPAVESINWVHLGGKPACPYRGLFAFREEDADIFFGREAVSEELYQRVESRQTLIAVVGASGSGKSSVVFAGLIPRLRNTEVEIVNFRPGKNPFESLAVALAPKWYEANHPGCDFENLASPERRCHELDLLITKLKDKRGLCEIVETIVTPSSHRLIIIADQFEELYTLLPQSEENTCKLFLDSLLNAINDSPAFTLVLTLRADFLHHAIKDHKFAKELNDKDYILAPMNREELQQAIRIPAQQRGVKLEPGLLELLLDDVGEKAENLPLLEFALTQLWTKQEYGLLTRNSYQEIGGLQQSLARHAEDIYTQLNAEQRQRMKRVFIQLMRPGEGAADTRNVVYKSELQDKDWDLITFLNQEDVRLVVINYDENRRETLEIVHEALINGWGRLSTWMGYHRQFRTWQERLKVGMKNWEEKHHDNGYLLTGGALGEAEGWLKDDEHQEYLSNPQRVFIQLSLDARDRKIKEEKRKQRRTVVRLSSALAIALAATGFACFNWVQAERSATISKIDSYRANSDYHFRSQQYEDALLESIKGNVLLENTWLKQWIPTNDKQKVKVSLHDAIHNYTTLETHTLVSNDKTKFYGVEFSPDGNTIASAESPDKTVKLWSADNGKLLHNLSGHKGPVTNVKYSPDGNIIASASSDGTVKLWSINGKLLNTLEVSKQPIWSVGFSPDGNTIASASSDKTIKIWSADNGKLLHSLSGHKGSVTSVKYSPDGNIIASQSKDDTVKLWSINGKLLHTLEGHKFYSNERSIEFSPDGKTIAFVSGDKTIKIWSTTDGKLLHSLPGNKYRLTSVKYSPDGNTIASASLDDTLKLWSTKNGNLLHTLPVSYIGGFNGNFSPDGNTIISLRRNKVKFWSAKNGQLIYTLYVNVPINSHSPNAIKFSPDGNTIALVLDNKTVKLFSIGNGKLFRTLSSHKDSVTSVEFSHDDNTIASASSDKTIKLWSAEDGKLLHTLSGHTDTVFSAKFSPDGNTIASASPDKTIKLWSVKNGKLLHTLSGHENWVMNAKFSPDGNTIASASRDKTIKLWSVKNGKLLHTLFGHKGSVEDLEFSPDGNTIASASEDNTLKLWSAEDGKLLHTLYGGTDTVYSAKFSPNGNTIASILNNHKIKLWSAKNGQLLHTLSVDSSLLNSLEFRVGNLYQSEKFSPDSNIIASALHNKIVQLWSVKNGKLLHTLSGHDKQVFSVDFSPDGNTIVSASKDGTVKLWSVKNGKLLHTLSGHKNKVLSVNFSHNGKTIASASGDGTVKLWNWNFDNLLTRGCNKLQGYLIERPKKLEELKACQNEEILTAAASTLVKQGEELANNGDFEGAVEKFRKAKKWNPKLDINPEVKAKSITN